MATEKGSNTQAFGFVSHTLKQTVPLQPSPRCNPELCGQANLTALYDGDSITVAKVMRHQKTGGSSADYQNVAFVCHTQCGGIIPSYQDDRVRRASVFALVSFALSVTSRTWV